MSLDWTSYRNAFSEDWPEIRELQAPLEGIWSKETWWAVQLHQQVSLLTLDLPQPRTLHVRPGSFQWSDSVQYFTSSEDPLLTQGGTNPESEVGTDLLEVGGCITLMIRTLAQEMVEIHVLLVVRQEPQPRPGTKGRAKQLRIRKLIDRSNDSNDQADSSLL